MNTYTHTHRWGMHGHEQRSVRVAIVRFMNVLFNLYDAYICFNI